MLKYSFSLELQWITGSSTFTLLYTVGVTLATLNDSIVRAAAYGYNDEHAAADDDDYQKIGIYEPINRMLLTFFLHKLTSECLWPKSQRHTTRLAIHLLYVLSNVRISIRKL